MARFSVAIAMRRTYVVTIDAASEAEARERAATMLTPPAVCINRDWRRVVSVEEIEDPRRERSA